MSEKVVKEVVISTPASAEPKNEDHLINSSGNVDGRNVPSDLKGKEKPVPHYLRASIGSCHDNCKFGIEHSPESRKYWPARRRRQDSVNTGNGKRDRAEIAPQRGRRRSKDKKLEICLVNDGSDPAKPKFTKLKAPLERVSDHSESDPSVEELPAEASEPVLSGTLPTDAKCRIISHDDVENCGDGESSEGAGSIELEMPSSIQDSDTSDDHIGDVIPPSEDVPEAGEQSPVDDMSDGAANGCVSSGMRNPQTVMTSEKHEQAEHGTKSESLSKESVKPKAKTTLTMTRNTNLSQKNVRTLHRKASGTAVVNPNGPKTMRKNSDASATTKLNREKKVSSTVAPAVPKVKEIEVSSPANAMDSSAKPSSLSKLKASTAKNAPSPSLPLREQTDRKMTMKNVAKNAQIWQKKGEEKAMLSPLKLSRSMTMSARSLSSIKMRAVKKEKSASPMKSNKKVYGAENAAADVLKGKILKMASPKVRKPEVDNKESRSCKEKTAIPRTDSARGPKSASISSSTATQSPRKLTFRRGKVLNLHSNSENNTPRRLRFRSAETADDHSRRRESTRGRITRKSDTAASKYPGASRAEVVVLRHQDVKDKKKNDQGLFNNVIEETASKLVEARKSKVKALVGAFETVILLQESKAAPAAAAAAP